jgi:hypothetical protein
MQRENLERWRKLCAEAAKEQDPQRLMELIEEINRLLELKQVRLRERPRDTK